MSGLTKTSIGLSSSNCTFVPHMTGAASHFYYNTGFTGAEVERLVCKFYLDSEHGSGLSPNSVLFQLDNDNYRGIVQIGDGASSVTSNEYITIRAAANAIDCVRFGSIPAGIHTLELVWNESHLGYDILLDGQLMVIGYGYGSTRLMLDRVWVGRANLTGNIKGGVIRLDIYTAAGLDFAFRPESNISSEYVDKAGGRVPTTGTASTLTVC